MSSKVNNNIFWAYVIIIVKLKQQNLIYNKLQVLTIYAEVDPVNNHIHCFTMQGYVLVQMDFGFPQHLLVEFLRKTLD